MDFPSLLPYWFIPYIFFIYNSQTIQYSMKASKQSEVQITNRVLSQIFDIAYHPALSVYQLTVTWQDSTQKEIIFMPETILFRGLQESLKVEDSYEESAMDQSVECSIEKNVANLNNEANSQMIWKNETRPQRQLRGMVERNLLIFEEVVKEEDER